MPPRHGKTELASIRFAPWYLGRNPTHNVIQATYSGEFAEDNGRKTRALVASPEYRAFFGFGLDQSSKAVSRWQTERGGTYFAVGVGGPLTGRGGNVLLIDDPHKNRQEAESETYRQRAWEWFTSTAYTRLEKSGVAIIIMTRWHEDDLVGRVLASGEHWEELILPAIAEEDDAHRKSGEALWPEKYNLAALTQIRDTVGAREWGSLYQQAPRPLSGDLFQVERLQTVDGVPVGTRFVRAWDLASTENGGDWTAGALIGAMPDGRTIIADMVRGQWGPQNVEAALVATASRDSVTVRIRCAQDPGQAGKAQASYLAGKLAGHDVTFRTVSGDKITRALPLAAQVNAGNVVLLRGGWNGALMDEMRGFPNAKHDDQIDAISDGFSELIGPTTTGIIDFYRG